MSRWRIYWKPVLVIFIFFVVTLSIYASVSTKNIARHARPVWGASFTKSFAEYLGLDWREVYSAALDDLGMKRLRIGLNWDEIEREPDKFDFSDFDWMMEEAEKRGAEIILAVGQKLPRWPECRMPQWAEKLSERDKQERILKYISESINHFKDKKAIVVWQAQNEPFFRFFGQGCPAPNKKFLEREIALVRSLDSSRPIMVTDSGELSLWWKSATLDLDILGVSMYRHTWNKYFGFRTYPFPPWVYNIKGRLISSRVPRIIISELQAEPWAPKGFYTLTLKEEARTMTHDKMEKAIQFARASNYDEIYLWGLEWWYLKKEKGDSFYWETIKDLLVR